MALIFILPLELVILMTKLQEESADATEPIATSIDTVFVPVTGFDAAIDWYSDVLGFPVWWRYDEAGFVSLEVGAVPLTLVRSSEPHRGEQELFNFYTDDFEATHRELQNRGVDVNPIEEGTGVEFFRFSDVCENMLGFCHYEK